MKHSPRFVAVVDAARVRIRQCTVDDVKKRMDDGEQFLLIDVREKDEWDNGHLPNAVHLGKGIIERDIHTIAPEVDTEMVLYCGGGYRSALAADNLVKMGYRTVISMDGGWREWNEKGYEVVKE